MRSSSSPGRAQTWARSPWGYLAAQYHRIAARRGPKRAVVAVAHSIVAAAAHLLRDGTTYRELGPNYFDARDRATLARRAIRRLKRLGFKVTIETH